MAPDCGHILTFTHQHVSLIQGRGDSCLGHRGEGEGGTERWKGKEGLLIRELKIVIHDEQLSKMISRI